MPENVWIDRLCVDVIERPLPGIHGAYLHQHQVILLSDALAPIQRRSTLMHELGHAFYGHTSSTARSEREASEWAACELIDAALFDQLTQAYESPVAVAYELGVLPRDVVNYERVRRMRRDAKPAQNHC